MVPGEHVQQKGRHALSVLRSLTKHLEETPDFTPATRQDPLGNRLPKRAPKKTVSASSFGGV